MTEEQYQGLIRAGGIEAALWAIVVAPTLSLFLIMKLTVEGGFIVPPAPFGFCLAFFVCLIYVIGWFVGIRRKMIEYHID